MDAVMLKKLRFVHKCSWAGQAGLADLLRLVPSCHNQSEQAGERRLAGTGRAASSGARPDAARPVVCERTFNRIRDIGLLFYDCHFGYIRSHIDFE